MAIPETQLDTWSRQGAVQTSKDTYATIRTALESRDAGYLGKDFNIFLQGSYGNDTNIYAESDVDVVIQLNATYFHEKSALPDSEKNRFDQAFVPATYRYDTYKADVEKVLRNTFGNDVKSGTKAIKVKANGSRRSADVIPACQFRHYYNTAAQFTEGICFFTSDGTRIVNYPKLHSANCTQKHQATNSWFKPTARILKNMRTRLVDSADIDAKLAPSYFIEGLLYNVPNAQFGATYHSTVFNCLKWLINTDEATQKNFVCANGQYYLLHNAGWTNRGSSPVTWDLAAYTTFLAQLAKLWDNWT